MTDAIIQGNQNTTKLINQLKSSLKQYPVLNKKQEREMIEKYRNDRDKLNYLLFMHNVRRVFNLAKAYKNKTNDYDGLVQNGMVGLAVAVQRFDIDRGTKFCTHASTWIHKYLSMPYYKSQFKIDMRTVSLNSPSPTAESDDVSAEDTLENCIHNFMDLSVTQPVKSVEAALSANEQASICKDLYEYINCDSSLSTMDKAVFHEIFVEEEKTRAIAEKYNIDMASVSEIRHRILNKCKTILEHKYSITSYNDI